MPPFADSLPDCGSDLMRARPGGQETDLSSDRTGRPEVRWRRHGLCSGRARRTTQLTNPVRAQRLFAERQSQSSPIHDALCGGTRIAGKDIDEQHMPEDGDRYSKGGRGNSSPACIRRESRCRRMMRRRHTNMIAAVLAALMMCIAATSTVTAADTGKQAGRPRYDL